MEQGVFLAWLKQEGEVVHAGDALFELEGDKAAQEIEALDTGTLRMPPDAPRAGDTVAVGAVLGYLLAAGEAVPWEKPAIQAAPRLVPVSAAAVAHAAAERELPAASGASAAQGASPKQNDRECRSTPRARKLARELGIDWKALKGSGRTGRVRERDIRAAAAHSPKTPRLGRGNLMPLTPTRRLIAERALIARNQAAPVTLVARADASNLVNLRSQFKGLAKSSGEPVPGYTDFFIKIAAVALREHPLLNACWHDEGIWVSEEVHIAFAVDTETGLVAPVVRYADQLGLRQVAARCRELVELAHARRLSVEQMAGGTFTITNLGMHGVESFTPLLNPPQCAILGLGRIRAEPAVHNNQIAIRDVIALCLTFDHRMVDGAPAARFLDAVRLYVEQPGPCLVS
jgi:pyruvate dehydrogenase E2 component (dihydrolipoamide acetyltransferase)